MSPEEEVLETQNHPLFREESAPLNIALATFLLNLYLKEEDE